MKSVFRVESANEENIRGGWYLLADSLAAEPNRIQYISVSRSMNMRQRNSAKPKPKLQVYVSREVADRLRDYASRMGVSASFATEMALRAYLDMEKVKI